MRLLHDLHLDGSSIEDLRGIENLHIINLSLTNAPVRDLAPVRTMRTVLARTATVILPSGATSGQLMEANLRLGRS